MKKLAFFAPALLAALISSAGLHADAVRLSSGQVLDGRIVEESAGVMVFETGKGTFAIERKDILEVERAGGAKIARVPDQKFDPLTGALVSFIPGYSGLYKTANAGAGVPFAMLNLVLFYRVARTTFARSPVDFIRSPASERAAGIFFSAGLTAARMRSACLPSCTQASLDAAAVVQDYGSLEYLTAMSQHQTNFAIGARIYSLEKMRKIRRNSILGYIGIGLLNAGASYYVLSGSSVAASSGKRAGDTVFYVTPGDGDSLGVGIAVAF